MKEKNIFKTMHRIHLKESKHSTHSQDDERYKKKHNKQNGNI